MRRDGGEGRAADLVRAGFGVVLLGLAPVTRGATFSLDACLASVPDTAPKAGFIRVVQIVNCSDQTRLGAANAAGSAGQTKTPVLPRESTGWVLKGFDPSSTMNGRANVITLDIPPQWASTGAKRRNDPSPTGPNIWVRTGCRFDIAADRAPCETGGAGGICDTSKAQLGPPPGATITEWNFYQTAQGSGGNTLYVLNQAAQALAHGNRTALMAAIRKFCRKPAS